MDFIRPIGPVDPMEIDPLARVERASGDERREQEEQRRRRREKQQREALLGGAELPDGTPETGDDGEQHIDVRV